MICLNTKMSDQKPSVVNIDEDGLSFSLSEDEADENTDSLDIKPPQAATQSRKSRHKKEKISSRLEKHGYRRTQHSRSDDRRKDYKSDRSQSNASQRDRDHPNYSKDTQRRPDHREKRERDRSDRDHTRNKKDSSGHKEERSEKRIAKDSNPDGHRNAAANEQLLEDLRGKLLEKRSQREGRPDNEPDRKRQKKEKKLDKERDVEVLHLEPLPETEKEKEERLQREERRAKLLEAEREMALRKEVSRRELEARRERHNIEKEKTRMLKEIAKKRKLEKAEENKSDEDGEISDKSDDSDDSDDSDSSSTTSSDDSSDTSEEEIKAASPESAPPLEKSPPTPKRPPVSNTSSQNGTPEPDHDSRENSPDPMDIDDDHYVQSSPKSDIILKEDTLPPYLPALQGCRSVEEFQCLNRIEEGTYGVVYRARDKKSSEIVALKRLKMEKEKEGFPITSLREINTILKAQHMNIVTVREIVVGSNMDKIFIVMDYVEHDLKSLMETMKSKKQVFLPGEIKCLMQQLLRAVAHLHNNWILHRDLKTSNLLLSHKGILKVGDFGLAREYGSPLKNYTPIVVTLWYRAPELLLQAKEYSTAIDVWSVGCIFGELLQMSALFNGTSEMNQLNKIFKELGTPNEKTWPGCSKLPAFQKVTFADFPVNQIRNRFGGMLSDTGIDLINAFLTYDPAQRITAEDALKHAYFREVPLPIDPAMFPTWPAKSEQGIKKTNNSPKPPSGGKAYKQLGDTDEELRSGGFHMGALERTKIAALGPGFSLKF